MCHKFAEAITVFIKHYKWLLDSYVIVSVSRIFFNENIVNKFRLVHVILKYFQEFFTEDHWRNLPSSWQEALSVADPKELGQILLNQK